MNPGRVPCSWFIILARTITVLTTSADLHCCLCRFAVLPKVKLSATRR